MASVIERAVRLFGFKEQMRMMQEEAAELIAAINRYERGRPGSYEAMIEEMADVKIVMAQMETVYGDDIAAAMEQKLKRLEERLEVMK